MFMLYIFSPQDKMSKNNTKIYFPLISSLIQLSLITILTLKLQYAPYVVHKLLGHALKLRFIANKVLRMIFFNVVA